MSFDHLMQKPWFMPKFSRHDAEYFLSQSPVGTFVIRPSSTPDCLALSQKNDDGEIFHARILCIRRGGQYVGYSIGGDSEVFSTVDALLKRVQPKTKLLAPSPSARMSTMQGGGGGGGFGGGRGGGPPSYPNPHMERSMSARGPMMNNNMMGGPPQNNFGQSFSGRPRPGPGGPGGPGGFGGGGFGGPAPFQGGQRGGMHGGGGGQFGGPPGGGRGLPPPRRQGGFGGPAPPNRPRGGMMGGPGPMGGGRGGPPPRMNNGGFQQQQQQQQQQQSSGFAPGSVLERSTQIDMSELMFEKEIGAGSFGTVYKGQWKSWTVAIKQLKNAVPEESEEYQDFVREAELMTRLRPHDNVVRFVGVTKPPNLCIVLEFVARGSLYDLLQADDAVSGETMLMILKGVCSGMAHLHEENVVHRDLAARNVLLDHNLVPKLGDFGMSRVLQSSDKSQTKSDTGPLKWMAPESIKNREYSRKSDIWAFAVVITEILTRCSEPYPDLEPIQVATRVAYEDLKPPIPAGASPTVVRVLQACSERDPNFRPEFTDVSEWLNWERTVWA